MAEEAQTSEVPEEAGTAEIEEADPEVEGAEAEAPVMLTTLPDKPVTSIGPMGRVLGSVPTDITALGEITSPPGPRTIETSWLKQK